MNSLQLIADAGSTSTTWVAITPDSVAKQFKTGPINPVTQPIDLVAENINEAASQLASLPISAVLFYGSGCRDAFADSVNSLLQSRFPDANVTVLSDIYGACRSACGSRAGIVAILGTGSNVCYYDGADIPASIPSLGFILGDEGSGSHIGRELLNALLKRRLPAEIIADFNATYGLTVDDVIRRVYRTPGANTFLASFATFAGRHADNPAVAALIDSCFDALFLRNINTLAAELSTSPQLNFVGSIAANFSPQLHAAAARHGHSIASIAADPIPGLIRYHQR